MSLDKNNTEAIRLQVLAAMNVHAIFFFHKDMSKNRILGLFQSVCHQFSFQYFARMNKKSLTRLVNELIKNTRKDDVKHHLLGKNVLAITAHSVHGSGHFARRRRLRSRTKTCKRHRVAKKVFRLSPAGHFVEESQPHCTELSGSFSATKRRLASVSFVVTKTGSHRPRLGMEPAICSPPAELNHLQQTSHVVSPGSEAEQRAVLPAT